METAQAIDLESKNLSPAEELAASKLLAREKFISLINEHGVFWTTKTPQSAYDELKECNKFLSEQDKRSASSHIAKTSY